MIIDLQHHSTYSDGQLTPTGVANFAYSNGVKVASLTDHNTVAGLDEFRKACKKRKIKSITGLELYVKLNHKKFNILWYNFDDTHPALHDFLRETQTRRRGNVRRILNKVVEKIDLDLNIEKVLDSHSHYIPINGIVYSMWKSKKNQKIFEKDLGIKNPREEDIMMEYLKNKKYGVLNESYVAVNRVFKLREKIGGQIILNHPGKNGHLTREQIFHLKELGLDGIEVLSPHHSLGAVMYFQYLSNEMDFIETGGSDFHIFEGGRAKIQNSWNYYKIDSKFLRKIEKVIGK